MNEQELRHHGVKGMKWGVRRYQNKDGSLTPAGKKQKRSASERLAGIRDKAVKNVKKKVNKKTAAKVARKGAEVCVKLANTAIMDQFVTGGMGRRALKETVKQTGRAVVTAYTMANGGYDIHWYDK